MRIFSTILAASLLAISAGAAHAADAQKAPDPPRDHTAIRFVDYGGIRDWRAQGNDALLIRAQNGKYYRAMFFGPCFGLDFTQRIGFVSDVMGSLDKFGSILVDGHECWFRSFNEIEKPEKW